MKHQYEVVCGNIGSVYSGTRKSEALKTFQTYKGHSETAYGRAANEEVTLFTDSEPTKSFTPETAVTAFVGSAWYEFCDPFMSVAFNPGRKRFASALKAADKLERLAIESAKDDYDGADYGDITKRAFLDSVCNSGVSLETGVELTDEQRSDFYGKQGYCYFDGL